MSRDIDQFSVYAPQNLGRQIREHSRRTGRDYSEIIVTAVEKYMNSGEPKVLEQKRETQVIQNQLRIQAFECRRMAARLSALEKFSKPEVANCGGTTAALGVNDGLGGVR